MDGVASGPLRCNGKVRVVEGEIPFELHGLEHAGDKVPCCDLTGLREQAIARRRRTTAFRSRSSPWIYTRIAHLILCYHTHQSAGSG